MATKITKRKPAKATVEKTPKKQTRLRKVMRFLFKAMLWFFGLSIFSVIVFKWVPVPFTPLMITRSIEQKWDGKEMVCKHDWVPIEDISINMQKAAIASEDDRFMTHNGFNWEAMRKAMKSNEKGKRLRGGSTISQQTAKNVFLWQGRSYIRKGFEAYFTFLIELIWGKERIMEVYLNSIEMGDGVYGVEAASQYWYKKKADNLSKREAAGIAAILPNPRKYKASNSSSYIERKKSKVIKLMRYVGKLDY